MQGKQFLQYKETKKNKKQKTKKRKATTSGHSENKREIKSPGQKIDRACGH